MGYENYIDRMMAIIQKQFLEVMSRDVDFYSQYKIILSNEQQYVKNNERNPKNIYIVVKFMPGTMNFGQYLYPVNFNALGEGNKLDVAQRLLLEYAQTFNLGEEETWSETYTDNGVTHTDNYIAKQVYTQPQVMSNFNTFTTEFRSLFYMSGTFLIGKNSMPITKITYYKSASDSTGTDIDFITSSWDFAIQLDSQAFYGTNSRTKSKSKIGTLVLSLVCYLTGNDLCKKVRDMAFDNLATGTAAANGIKEKFYFSITFADGHTVSKMEFHLSEASSPQSVGELPLLSLTFTN